MHHAPAGPPLSARLAAALGRSRSRLLAVIAVVRPGLRVLRRTRLVPVLLAGLVIGVLALAAPVPAVGRTPASTAALTAPSDGGRELVPATGDGWTEDGAPSAPAPDNGAAAGQGTGSAPVGGTASEAPAAQDTAPSSAAQAPVRAETAPETSTGSPTETPVAGTSSTTAPSSPAGPGSTDPTASRESSPSASSSSPSAPSSSPSASSSSAAPSSAPAPPSSPAVADSAAVDQVLAAVNAARAGNGCEPLTADAGLAGTAAAHSAAMRDQATLLPPPGAGAVAGELDDPAAVAAGWLADTAVPSTDCALTTAGIAVADGWWTLLLA